MTIKVQWLIENRIILTHFIDDVTSEQLLTYLEESFAMRDKANEVNGEFGYLVHTITDATRVKSQQIDLSTTQKIMKSLRKQRVGWSLYVDDNRMNRFFTSLAHQFGGIRYQSFSTMQDAIDYLSESDETLRDELAQIDLSQFIETAE